MSIASWILSVFQLHGWWGCWWLWYCVHLGFDLCCINVCGISCRCFSNGLIPLLSLFPCCLHCSHVLCLVCFSCSLSHLCLVLYLLCVVGMSVWKLFRQGVLHLIQCLWQLNFLWIKCVICILYYRRKPSLQNDIFWQLFLHNTENLGCFLGYFLHNKIFFPEKRFTRMYS